MSTVEYVCFGIVVASATIMSTVLIHTIVWLHSQQQKHDFGLSKPIFITAIGCLILLDIYCLNWVIMVIWDLFFPFKESICFYQWHNDAIYYLGKGFMYSFFFARSVLYSVRVVQCTHYVRNQIVLLFFCFCVY